MKKICFISDSFLWEEKIRPVLHRAISHVIEQNDAVEFWFHTLREPFLQEAVIAIPEIRKSSTIRCSTQMDFRKIALTAWSMRRFLMGSAKKMQLTSYSISIR